MAIPLPVFSDYPKLLVWDVDIRLLCLDSVEAVSSGILLVQSLVPEIGMTDFLFDISIKGAAIFVDSRLLGQKRPLCSTAMSSALL